VEPQCIIFSLFFLLLIAHIATYVFNVRILKRVKKHNFELYVEMLDGRPDSFIDREFPLMRSPDDPRMLRVFKKMILAGKCDELLPFKSRGLYRSLFWIKLVLVCLIVVVIVSTYLQMVVFR
jgi:hypothetical protein